MNNSDGGASADDVTNPANYLLVEIGLNDIFDTTACSAEVGGSLQPDDVQVAVNKVIYDNPTRTATVNINDGTPLPFGLYKLLVCGSTSIVDLAGNHLNGGTDSTYIFTILEPEQEPLAVKLPDTGFAPRTITKLPQQPANKAYSSTGITLNIPSLNISMPIVGVPLIDGEWDVSWLSNNAGYLAGSAFPTWAGNTVLTGHVWDALNQPGPFADLKAL